MEKLKKELMNNMPVTIFLTNGVKLKGRITEKDDDSFCLTRGNTSQLVFRHAVATIFPEGSND